jgi:hypothetical protein
MTPPPRRVKKGYSKAQLKAAHAEDSKKSYHKQATGQKHPFETKLMFRVGEKT